MKWAASLTAALLLVASCGSEDPSRTRVPPGRGDSLAGRAFLSTERTEAGLDRPLVAGTRVRLAFDDGTVAADAGCNHMSGTARINGARLRVGALATTEIGCDPERHAQDDWLAGFLGSAPRWGLDGDTLVLRAGATRLALLDREVADPDRPLVNTRWHVITIISGETASSVAADAIATLSFAADGRVTVDTSCNLGSASYRREGTIVVLGALTLDTAVCAADHAALEDALIQLFDARRISTKVEADLLMLRTTSADGVDLRATAG